MDKVRVSTGAPRYAPLPTLESNFIITDDTDSTPPPAPAIQPPVKIKRTSSTNTSPIKGSAITSPERDEFRRGFRDCLLVDNTEYGTKSMAEIFIEGWMNRGALQIQMWLGEIYLENQTDPDNLIALLKIVMHMDPNEFNPMNRMVALASLSHTSLEVRECAVRCYEYWEDRDFYIDLQERKLEPAWLEAYKNSFINQ